VAEGSQRKEVSHGACIFTELRAAAGVLEFVREDLRFPRLTASQRNPRDYVGDPRTSSFLLRARAAGIVQPDLMV
jgi:hypothetical protein